MTFVSMSSPASLVGAVTGQHEPVAGSVREQQHHARLVAACTFHGRPAHALDGLAYDLVEGDLSVLEPRRSRPWVIVSLAMIASVMFGVVSPVPSLYGSTENLKPA